jgi:hypothetical protein
MYNFLQVIDLVDSTVEPIWIPRSNRSYFGSNKVEDDGPSKIIYDELCLTHHFAHGV